MCDRDLLHITATQAASIRVSEHLHRVSNGTEQDKQRAHRTVDAARAWHMHTFIANSNSSPLTPCSAASAFHFATMAPSPTLRRHSALVRSAPQKRSILSSSKVLIFRVFSGPPNSH